MAGATRCNRIPVAAVLTCLLCRLINWGVVYSRQKGLAVALQDNALLMGGGMQVDYKGLS